MTLAVIGAGLAGLSCALAAADAGLEVVLHEAAGHAGGRCRSWFDPNLGAVIDNGSHLVVGGNDAVFRHLARIGASEALMPGPSDFPMRDLESGEGWTASPARLLPTVLASVGRLALGGDASIARRLGGSRQFRRLWEPLALAIMNTPAEVASAHVFRRVLARTLWRGQAASRPFLARHGLSEAFVAPALTALGKAGVTVRFHHPLRSLSVERGRVAELGFDDESILLQPNDAVVLAVPWTAAAGLLPELPVLPSSPIVNAHFRLPPSAMDRLPEGLLGVLGGQAQWLFRRGDLLSATVSAASDLAERSVGEVAERLWADVAKALEIKDDPLALRVIKEKRATLFHSAETERRRPSARLRENLFLAGDWTATGLPCTLEGALRSGETAARKALGFIRA